MCTATTAGPAGAREEHAPPSGQDHLPPHRQPLGGQVVVHKLVCKLSYLVFSCICATAQCWPPGLCASSYVHGPYITVQQRSLSMSRSFKIDKSEGGSVQVCVGEGASVHVCIAEPARADPGVTRVDYIRIGIIGRLAARYSPSRKITSARLRKAHLIT